MNTGKKTKPGSFPVGKAIRILRDLTKEWKQPIVTEISRRNFDPFSVLISTMLSLRTKDATTSVASKRLFKLADTPEKMLKLSREQVVKAIYPVGFYKTKAKSILKVCSILIDQFGGKVPADIEKLVLLPGVGRKTANLVMTHGHRLPGICVDTHVHRISNRWKYISTKTPEKSEMALRKILPRKYWIEYNDLLVTFGQNMCKPVSPLCSNCPIEGFCPKAGVKYSR